LELVHIGVFCIFAEKHIMNQDECLICGAPLEYLEQDTLMECATCHYSARNNQCIGKRCPFSPLKETTH